ncbi:hypothetical protein V6N13_139411 [Hibiscus sabdariffa]|uniref:Secreted protein n=1 Tax=Hibiscus sabdariffa TaxID=183260 RepID=A0ABR2C871_9ROSI
MGWLLRLGVVIIPGVQSCARQFCKVQPEEFDCEDGLGVGGSGLCFVTNFCCSRVSIACGWGVSWWCQWHANQFDVFTNFVKPPSRPSRPEIDIEMVSEYDSGQESQSLCSPTYVLRF